MPNWGDGSFKGYFALSVFDLLRTYIRVLVGGPRRDNEEAYGADEATSICCYCITLYLGPML